MYRHDRGNQAMTLFLIDPEKSYVYVLKLRSTNKYYVGYSSELSKRLDSHVKGKGAEFTKKHGVDRLVALIECNDPGRAKELEATLTEFYMKVYGKNNVRGAGYTDSITNEEVNVDVIVPESNPISLEENDETVELSHEDEELFEQLKQLRLELSRRNSIPAYTIFRNLTLSAIAKMRPKTKEEMLRIRGVGPKNYDNYGEDFIEAVKSFEAEK